MAMKTAVMKEWEIFAEEAVEKGRAFIDLPDRPRFGADLSSQSGPGGAFAVPADSIADAVETGLYASPIRRLATIVRPPAPQDGQASEYNVPLMNPGLSSNGIGEVLAEKQSATFADPLFAKLVLHLTKYSSKSLKVPSELLTDGAPRVIPALLKGLAQRIARRQNQDFTSGDGGAKPLGAVPAATNSGTVASITYDALVDLLALLDPRWFEDPSLPPRFMMNSTVYAIVKKLKDSQNQPIFPGGLSLFGLPVELNPDCPNATSGLRPILLGRFDRYVVRDDPRPRFVAAYEQSGAVDNDQFFCTLYARADGGLLIEDSTRAPLVALQIT
jgi:HK97 family phage major capsid protein